MLECATLECYKCRAVFNNFCALDSVSKIFKCSFCGFHNPLPSNYQNNTILEKETIEYFSTQKQSFLHILFVIDITSESLNDLKSSLLLLMNILPNNVFIGIITFSSHVYVYDLQSDHLKCISLRGNKEYDSKLILNLLNISPFETNSFERFFANVADININCVIESLEADVVKQPNMRKERCTGTALNVSIELLRQASSLHKSCKILLFTSGAATVGQGKIVNLCLFDHIRTFHDITKKKAEFLTSSTEFYKSLSTKAYQSGLSVNIFCGSIDQCGLYEMESLTRSTGGYIFLYDSYSNINFRNALISLFSDTKCLNSNCEISVHCSSNIKVCGSVSLGFSNLNHSFYCSKLSSGLTHTNS